MPAFYILVLIGVCLLWLILSFLYKPLGKLANRLWNDAKEAITEEDKNNTKENN